MHLHRIASAVPLVLTALILASMLSGCPETPCSSGLPRFHGACVMRCADPRYQCYEDGGVIDGAPMLDAEGFDVPIPDSGDVGLDVAADVTDGSDSPIDVACSSGQTSCQGSCVDPSSDPAHCGLCSTVCPAATHGTATCTSGTCGLNCETGFHACGSNCADDSSPGSCGTSCTPCSAPAGARGTCASGTCGWECLPGFVLNAGACELTAPRPLRPLSGSWSTTRRPSFGWIAPSGVDGAEVEVCRDRTCTMSIVSFAMTGTTATSPSDLPVGVVYWRLRGRSGAVTGTATSAVWELEIRPNSGAPATFGVIPDFNGDGRSDALVAAEGSNTAYFIAGSSSGLSTSSIAIAPPPRSSGFAHSLSAAGDVDGDGFVDFVVGAYGSQTLYLYRGQAAGPDVVPAQTILAPSGSSEFSWLLSNAGDVNEDGYADVVVTDSVAHRAFVFLGSEGGLQTIPSQTLGTADMCGDAAGAGDFDADGHVDLAVSNSAGGRICIFYGDGLHAAARSDVIVGPGGGFGSRIGVADLDGDGHADVVSTFSGTARAYLGSAGGIATGTFSTVTIGTGLGSSISAGGDANGDGVSDVVIGGNGAVILYGGVGGISNTSSRGTAFATPSGAMLFGSAVSIIGDTTGDHIGEVLVGARNSNRAYLYLGSPLGVDGTSGTLIPAPTGATYFGTYIASLAPDRCVPQRWRM